MFPVPMGETKSSRVLQNTGQWNMRDKKYYQPGYVSEWVVINFANEKGIEQIVKGLVECCHARGTFFVPQLCERPRRFCRNCSPTWGWRSNGNRETPPAKDYSWEPPKRRSVCPRDIWGWPLSLIPCLAKPEASGTRCKERMYVLGQPEVQGRDEGRGVKRHVDPLFGGGFPTIPRRRNKTEDQVLGRYERFYDPVHRKCIITFRDPLHHAPTRLSQRQKDPSTARNKFNDQYFNNLGLKWSKKLPQGFQH